MCSIRCPVESVNLSRGSWISCLRYFDTMAPDVTERFTGRVESYAKYRPGYPQELIQCLFRETGLGPGKRVADIGSGTGICSRLLLEAGAEVHAVEPNREMREAA